MRMLLLLANLPPLGTVPARRPQDNVILIGDCLLLPTRFPPPSPFALQAPMGSRGSQAQRGYGCGRVLASPRLAQIKDKLAPLSGSGSEPSRFSDGEPHRDSASASIRKRGKAKHCWKSLSASTVRSLSGRNALLQIWMEVAGFSNMVRVLLGKTWERGREGG